MKKIIKKVISKISMIDINLKKNYELQRKITNIIHPVYLKNTYKKIDTSINLENRNIPIRMFFPKDGLPKDLILYFHGGGFVTGSIDSYNKTCSRISNETNRIVVSVEYRLAPEYKYPCGLNDCYDVAKCFFMNQTIFDINPKNIILMGDSAGANIAAALSIRARNSNDFFPTRQILIYPLTYFDHSMNSPFDSIRENGESYLLTSKAIRDYLELYINNEDDLSDSLVAPLLESDLSRQPKTLIITAELDPLRDEGEAYGKKLKEFGNDVEIHRINDVIHGFFSNPTLFNDSINESYVYIKKFLGDDYY